LYRSLSGLDADLHFQFHTASNKEKMGNGVPLTDADRWDWLICLRNEAVRQLQTCNSVIVTCSALKHKYRDVIRIANYEHPTVQVHFIYLKVDEQTLQDRVAHRVGHYMKEGMVHSQMTALEEPDVEDETDVIPVDVTNDKDVVQKQALERVKEKLKEYEGLAKNA
jgi:gluconokinase